MPELPEVETIRMGLQKYLVGHKVIGVEIRLKKLVSGETKNIIGAKVKDVKRFGKGLVLDFDNGFSIASHIKLTGQFIYQGPDLPKHLCPSKEKVGNLPNKWTHVIFKLDRGAVLYYNDLRQFGWIKIIKTTEVQNLPFFKELGPEPFNGLTSELFREIVKSSTSPIKIILMDQKRIGGVGNIYANDALFLAKIDPRRKSASLSTQEIKRLYESIEKVLKKGLEQGGATELNYVNAFGMEGGYQKYFSVYGKEGEKCNNCGGIIKKIKLGGRGTYFCPACQR
ncbi:MAG: bifunctional DNA-formamidopyrimidine glycosylase/DNA-(apurinic or apyrimidinic site) lyase [Patescibacteria group bacterium]|nr:bifunctional DNA-formamidopyrimidine glycosylase/DNA-(apurinic or apyrimidinic site) lyase [Patescibacteria group bacterium]